MEWAVVVDAVGRLDNGKLAEGSIAGELDLLHDLSEGLAVTELLLKFLSGAVGDVEGTELVFVAASFLRGG